ncbi:hypothetical protein KP509_27G009900 [Ceratopteris richardii]|uniref:Pectinesterase n=1 Tax=Ceratopteris richardii TaxID=49495 RepID=A0A8T2RG83_CERRI|nr:hypothetical protein KP509_27G009900 [Ceratopteris richardii]
MKTWNTVFTFILFVLVTSQMYCHAVKVLEDYLESAKETEEKWGSKNLMELAVGDEAPQEDTVLSGVVLKGLTDSLLPTFLQLETNSRTIVVDQHGKGHFRSVQAAIDSVQEDNRQWVYIRIGPGIFYEKVTVPYKKPFIAIQGAGRASTIISWKDRASKFGTANSATFTVNAPRFIAKGVGFRNAAPPPAPGTYGGQAVAVLLNGDMMAFYECGFYGAQDTLFDYYGRHYFKNCYIQGSIDFIFGHGQSFFKECRLVVTAQSGYISGSITAQNRNDPHDAGGFVFMSCTITGTGYVYLGRAWGSYSRVVFLYTYMNNIIVPDGWYDWGQPSRRGTVFYGQYKCSGPGSRRNRRVPWSHELSDAQAQPFLQLSFIGAGNWLQET